MTLSAKKLNISNIVLSLILIIFSQVLSQNSGVGGLDILGIIVFLISCINVIKFSKVSNYFSRITLLVSFIGAVLVSFTPFIFQFADNTNLFILTQGISLIWLILLYFTKYKIN